MIRFDKCFENGFGNYNNDYKMLNILAKNKYFQNWITEAWVKRHIANEDKFRKILEIERKKEKVNNF